MSIYKIVYYLGLWLDPEEKKILKCEQCQFEYENQKIVVGDVKKIVDIHHINSPWLGRKTFGGANDVTNLIGLCREHHNKYAKNRDLHRSLLELRLNPMFYGDDSKEWIKKIEKKATKLSKKIFH